MALASGLKDYLWKGKLKFVTPTGLLLTTSLDVKSVCTLLLPGSIANDCKLLNKEDVFGDEDRPQSSNDAGVLKSDLTSIARPLTRRNKPANRPTQENVEKYGIDESNLKCRKKLADLLSFRFLFPEQEMNMVGEWAYKGSNGAKTYKISREDGRLFFNETLTDGTRNRGELIFDGERYAANLANGVIRLTLECDTIQSQFMSHEFYVSYNATAKRAAGHMEAKVKRGPVESLSMLEEVKRCRSH